MTVVFCIMGTMKDFVSLLVSLVIGLFAVFVNVFVSTVLRGSGD